MVPITAKSKGKNKKQDAWALELWESFAALIKIDDINTVSFKAGLFMWIDSSKGRVMTERICNEYESYSFNQGTAKCT